jgi:hypothetical protein
MRPFIVVEGHDNSGKSTLARHIADRFGFYLQESEGPPTEHETIDDRIRRYFKRDMDADRSMVYARHPVVSQPIYSSVKGNRGDVVDPLLVEEFYRRDPILIYCDPVNRGMGEHKIKPHDTPEFIEGLKRKYVQVLEAYRTWAVVNATVIWRIGDDELQLMRLVETLLRYRVPRDSLRRTRTV